MSGTTHCLRCQRELPLLLTWPLCPCGGVPALPVVRDPGRLAPTGAAIWRYREALGVPPAARDLTLGEGDVPLESIELPGLRPGVWVLRDDLQPSGSWKDRGSPLLIAALQAAGHGHLIEDSSGNAALSLARYAQRAGLSFTAYVPAAATAVKKELIRAAGAELIEIEGPRQNATLAAREAAEAGAIWASHALQPLHAIGAATIAFELCDRHDFWPDAIVLPTGQGGYLAGLAAGLRAISQARGLTMPRLIGVQTELCAPLAEAFRRGASDATPSSAPAMRGLAEGVMISTPQRGQEALRAVRESAGLLDTCNELTIERAVRLAWREGLRIEPTAALGLAYLLDRGARTLRDAAQVVVLLSGHGVRDSRTLFDGWDKA